MTSNRQRLLMPVSAPTDEAADRAAFELECLLSRVTDADLLADVSYTLTMGRRAWAHRRLDVYSAAACRCGTRRHGTVADTPPPLVYLLCAGVGDEYPGMGHALYRDEPTFRYWVDADCATLESPLISDVRRFLLTESGSSQAAADQLRALVGRGTTCLEAVDAWSATPEVVHSALFIFEHALAKLLDEWGVRPAAVLGHSLGEYVAATLAGVFRSEEALSLVVARARLLTEFGRGAMLAIHLGREEVRPFLTADVHLVVINGPRASVVAGSADGISALANRLSDAGVACRRLPTGTIVHSRRLVDAKQRMLECFKRIDLRPAAVPYVSNLTGTWIRPEDVQDPQYWARHLCEVVRFDECTSTLAENTRALLLEVGPGCTLTVFVSQHPGVERGRVIATGRSPGATQDASTCVLSALSRVWLAGGAVDWAGFWRHERRRPVDLRRLAASALDGLDLPSSALGAQ